MQRPEVSKETRKANIRVAILLGIVALMGMFSAFFMLGEKL
jgi:hypothetical protein